MKIKYEVLMYYHLQSNSDLRINTEKAAIYEKYECIKVIDPNIWDSL